MDLAFFYLIYKKMRSQQLWKYCDNNKCYNIFSKHLFSVVIGHNLIFYYFILTCKKLTLHQLWKYYEICCINITIYMPDYINISKEKKNTNRLLGKKKKNFRHCSYLASWINQKHCTISVVTFSQNIYF